MPKFYLKSGGTIGPVIKYTVDAIDYIGAAEKLLTNLDKKLFMYLGDNIWGNETGFDSDFTWFVETQCLLAEMEDNDCY